MNIKFFKKENNFKKKNFAFNSNLYWKIFVAGTLVIILFIFYFGYNLFMQINQESAIPATNTSGQIPTVSPDRMKKALDNFSARETKSNQIINSPSPVVDPSL